MPKQLKKRTAVKTKVPKSGKIIKSTHAKKRLPIKPRKAASKPRKAAPKPRKAASKPRKAASKPRKAAPKPRKATSTTHYLYISPSGMTAGMGQLLQMNRDLIAFSKC